MPKDKKDEAIQEVMKELNKKYQEDSVTQGEEIIIDTIPTNCLSLDWILGCGGFPRGRIIEVYGQESSGKTTMALFIAAQVQKKGGRVFWVDAECCMDSEYSKKIGVDTKNLIIHKPMSGEEGFDALEKMIKTNSIDLIVVDSVAALVPQEELDGDIGDKKIALQARLLSKGLRAITGILSQTKTSIIFINQLRDNLMTFGYGPKTITPGGKALKFYASVRLAVRKGKKIEGENKDIIGNQLIVKAEKNKVGLPFRETTLDLYFSKGIDIVGDLIDFGNKIGVVERTGNSYIFKEVKLGGSRDKARDFLEKNPEVADLIKEEIKIKIKI
jgi:recombination protein RecA